MCCRLEANPIRHDISGHAGCPWRAADVEWDRMLREVSHVSRPSREGPRRCFADERMHLLVWYEDDGRIYGFELTYESAKGPRALRWLPDGGFLHAHVDDGTPHPFLDASAILISCDDPVSKDLPERFREAAAEIPQAERDFVAAKLTERID
jgi:hypothetical protein